MRAIVLVAFVALVAAACTARGGAPVGSTSTSTSTSATTSTSAAASTSATRSAAGDTAGQVVTADGRTRTFRLHVPATLPAGPVPLLVALHGGLGSAQQFERASGFDALADQRGFVVVYPDGVGVGLAATTARTWNAGTCCGPAALGQVDDVGFVRQLLDTVEARYQIDPNRVFAAGHSNGAFMAYRLACELSDRIVAVGLQAGGLTVADCHPSAPVSLLHIHGLADTNVPIAGGIGSGVSNVSFPPLATSLSRITSAMGCASTPAVTNLPGVETRTWERCDGGATVELRLVAGAPHMWMRPPVYDSATAIVDFLLDHPRGSTPK
jgi:polyhydroxybutyrate depolymerase